MEFLEVQWLGLSTFIAEGPGSIPGWGTKIPQAVQSDKKRKKGTLPLPKPKIPQKTLYTIASASDMALSMILEHWGETSEPEATTVSSVTELVLPNKDGGEVTPEGLSLTFLVHAEPELIIAELRLLHGLLLLEPGVGRSALLHFSQPSLKPPVVISQLLGPRPS